MLRRFGFACAIVWLFAQSNGLSETGVKQEPEVPDVTSPASNGAKKLAPVRRVGVVPVSHNVREFLVRMEDQSAELKGFVASPLHGGAVEFRLWTLVQQAAREGGRFWVMRFDEPGSEQAGDQGGGRLVPSRELVQSAVDEWHIDAWAQPSVEFFPDFSRLNLQLVSALTGRTLAVQSVEIAAMASESAIAHGFLLLWSRVGLAIGHLSSISWQSGDLVTVDIGTPQLRPGDELVAGEVAALREHPRDGEVLSVTQRPLAALRIIEVSDGSSLGRLTQIAESQAANGVKGLLVWRDAKQAPSAGGPESGTAAETSLRAGKVQDGFAFRDLSVEERAPLQVPPPPALLPRGDAGSSSPMSAGPSRLSSSQEPSGTQQSAADGTLAAEGTASQEELGTVFDGEPGGNYPWADALATPELWMQGPVSLSAGQSWGILDTSPCENTPCSRYTGFPRTLLNLFGVSLSYRLTRTSGLVFDGRFVNYAKGDVDGYELGVRALSMHDMSRSTSDRFALGFGPELEIGKVETVLVERSLLALTIRAAASYEFATSLGAFGLRADVSALDLLGGRLVVDSKFGGRALAGLPEPLELFFGARRASGGWLQLEFGAGWTFPGGHQ